jgi:hypothetical protein
MKEKKMLNMQYSRKIKVEAVWLSLRRESKMDFKRFRITLDDFLFFSALLLLLAVSYRVCLHADDFSVSTNTIHKP